MKLSVYCHQQLSDVFTYFHVVLVLSVRLNPFYHYAVCVKTTSMRNPNIVQEGIQLTSN